jgi:hypothetical protein
MSVSVSELIRHVRLPFALARRSPDPVHDVDHLHPYRRNKGQARGLWILALMLFCVAYGFAFALIAPSLLPVLLAPVIGLAGLVVWVLPDTIPAPTRWLSCFFWAFFISLVVWPNYIALQLPGLPWITLQRLTSLPLLFVLLVCLSVSSEFRRELRDSLRSITSLSVLLAIFVCIQLYSIALSSDIATSIQKFFVAQSTWTTMFIASAYLFRKPGEIKRWAAVLWGMAVFVSLIAIWEFRIGHLPWENHIPSFLKIDADSVQRTLSGVMRAGTNRYRAEATFSTPLGLAEYLAIAMPFVLHFALERYKSWVRLTAVLSLPLLCYAAYLTDAKLGTIGCFVAILLSVLVEAIRARRRNKNSLIASAVVISYPLLAAASIATVLSFHRLRVLLLGDGSHANSTAARVEQYATGLEKMLKWPFGYGIGMGAATLGFGKDIGGMITIDTYYLQVALEYGILGFITFYGIFIIAIYEAGRRGVNTRMFNRDRAFLIPLSLSLFNFVMIKAVFSQQDNHPLVFMMLGAVVAIAAQSKSPRQLAATPNI